MNENLWFQDMCLNSNSKIMTITMIIKTINHILIVEYRPTAMTYILYLISLIGSQKRHYSYLTIWKLGIREYK